MKRWHRAKQGVTLELAQKHLDGTPCAAHYKFVAYTMESRRGFSLPLRWELPSFTMTSIAFRHLNDWSGTSHVLATAGVGTGPSSQASMPTDVAKLLYVSGAASCGHKRIIMQLYDSFGPNPRAMRMFLVEKGIDIPRKDIDLRRGENRRPPFTDRNPGGQLPALELDNGKCIGETIAIWEYLEEKSPNPPLIGTNAEDRAEARMWQRRIEQRITENLYNGFRFAEGQEIFNGRMRLIPEAAPGLKATVQDNLKWLDGLLEGKEYIAGNRFTIADIILYCALDFGSGVGQEIDPSLKNVSAWFKRIESRPSAQKSEHPAAGRLKLKG